MIGNAVPVQLAYHLAMEIKTTLSDNMQPKPQSIDQRRRIIEKVNKGQEDSEYFL